MGIIYYRWTATCLLEFQAADRSRDLPHSIFTFQLRLNRHDKHTEQKGPAVATLHFHTASNPRQDRPELTQKFPDMVAEGGEQREGGEEGEREREEGEKLNELEANRGGGG